MWLLFIFLFLPPLSHRKKRMRQLQKKLKSGSVDVRPDDPFELFIAATSIRYCYYAESHKILGNTYGMCVLQVRRQGGRWGSRVKLPGAKLWTILHWQASDCTVAVVFTIDGYLCMKMDYEFKHFVFGLSACTL